MLCLLGLLASVSSAPLRSARLRLPCAAWFFFGFGLARLVYSVRLGFSYSALLCLALGGLRYFALALLWLARLGSALGCWLRFTQLWVLCSTLLCSGLACSTLLYSALLSLALLALLCLVFFRLPLLCSALLWVLRSAFPCCLALFSLCVPADMRRDRRRKEGG